MNCDVDIMNNDVNSDVDIMNNDVNSDVDIINDVNNDVDIINNDVDIMNNDFTKLYYLIIFCFHFKYVPSFFWILFEHFRN
jgi:hypothetical protein